MTTPARSIRLTLASTTFAFAALLSGAVLAGEASTPGDELCTDCGSYTDAEVAGEPVRSAYVPGVGYGSDTTRSGSEAYLGDLCKDEFPCDPDGSLAAIEAMMAAAPASASQIALAKAKK